MSHVTNITGVGVNLVKLPFVLLERVKRENYQCSIQTPVKVEIIVVKSCWVGVGWFGGLVVGI